MDLSLAFSLIAIVLAAVGAVWFVRSLTSHRRPRTFGRIERY